jgi:GntR family transcriptional regulator, transcriptional repressor for pyruvate dehydrogenase complex
MSPTKSVRKVDPARVKRVRRIPKASDVLAGEIRKQILRRRLPSGSRLRSESELISDSGFSRATVREALRLLEAEGFISVKRGPRGGIVVAYPDAQHVTRVLASVLAHSDATLSNLFAIRRLLEPVAAAAAAESASEEQRQMIERASAAELEVGHTVHFHFVLAEATGNPLLRVLVTVINDILELHAPDEHLTHADLAAAARHHAAIAQAIIACDAAAAHREMLRHIDKFEQALGRQGRLNQLIVPRLRDVVTRTDRIDEPA